MTQEKCRILCVDDHDDTSEMLRLLLTGPAYDVRTARTMEEALGMAGAHEFDLFVLDKRLPDGTGLELCKKLQLLSPGVPCIFYTGDTYETHREEALLAGADAYVAKPDLDNLIKTVEDLLDERECPSAQK